MGLATVPIVIGATGLDPTEPHLACHRRLCEARLTIRLRKEARGPASALKQQCATSKPCASTTQAASASAPIGSYNFSWR